MPGTPSTPVGRGEIVEKGVVGKRSRPIWAVCFKRDDSLKLVLELEDPYSSPKMTILRPIAGKRTLPAKRPRTEIEELSVS